MDNQSLADDITGQVVSLAKVLTERGWLLACAESCTGGLLAKSCTDLAGSSAWFDRGFVTYSNAAKQRMLGVDPDLITQHGAVSEAVARAMAEGVLRESDASLGCAITGIAGPGGGTPGKPVGTVWFGFAGRDTNEDRVLVEQRQFAGDRAAVRDQATLFALQTLLQMAVESGD